MIDITKYEKLLNDGLSLDHYSVLCSIRDGNALPKSKRIQGFINLLCKKGYIKDGILTDIGTNLITTDILVTTSSTTTTTTEAPMYEKKGLLRTAVPSKDFLLWTNTLHGKLQNKLKEKTGKVQARGTIRGTTYSFLPNASDLAKVILRVVVSHKLTDFDKIEKCLLRYIDKRLSEGDWFPIMIYYISKDGLSAMVTDMEGMDEEDDIISDTSVNI